MLRASILVVAAGVAFFPLVAHADEQPRTLLSRLGEWMYPDARMTGASMSDAATVDSHGERTVPSIHCKAVLTTSDPIDKVLARYRSKLDDKTPGDDLAHRGGRSVMFHSDSEGRPVAVHMISVNTARTSTTLVISRAESESETHIAWSQYEWFDVQKK